MAANQQRSTAGRFLIVWAVLMTFVVLNAWRVQLHPEEYLWNEFVSGLGDREYYTQLSDNDFYTAALQVPGEKTGQFRRGSKPVARNDARMLRLSRDASGRVFVYRDQRQPGSYFLKVADDRYVEFGARNTWPEYQPPKAIPYKP